MRSAQIVLDIPTRALDKPFDYLVPANMAALEVGCCVLVTFSHRPAVGYVVGFSEVPSDADLGRYLFVEQVLSTPYFDEHAACLARWIAREYVAPLSESMHLFAPPGGTPKVKRIQEPAVPGSSGSGNTVGWELVDRSTGAVEDTWVRITPAGRGFQPPRAAVKQQAVMAALREGEMRLAELSIEVGAVNATVKALEKRGMLTTEKRRRLRGCKAPLPPEGDTVTLTEGQENGLAAVDAAFSRGQGDVVLLDGVTGSGKTEVYLRAIRHVLEAGRSAIVLVPEIALTPQTVGRFRARFGELVAVLHSGMGVGERYDQWDLCRNGSARVCVGARSALFAPLHDVGLIVIDEEHEGTYKQDSSPRYLARDVAVHMMRERGGAVVLGSATPSLETLERCDKGIYKRVELPQRARHNQLPSVQIVDMGAEFTGGHRSMFSRTLQEALAHTLAEKQKAVFLFNHRGFASFLLCRECGYVPTCDQCSTSLTYHSQGGGCQSLQCHHCGSTYAVPTVCPRCGSPYLKKMGAGTQQVHDALRALVGPDETIVRMDADTTRTKGSHERLLSEFAAAPSGILLGTQMIAKGLDFPDVTLVGVISADTMLNLPDFRAGERTYQLLEQVAGRAGRDRLPGRVVVQTYWPNHPAVVAAAAHKRSIFTEAELKVRRELSYPPFSRLANILVWGKDDGAVTKAALELGTQLDEVFQDLPSTWQLLGPSPCVLARLRGTYRWHLLVKAPVGADIPSVVVPVMAKRKKAPGVSTAVDVDPANLF